MTTPPPEEEIDVICNAGELFGEQRHLTRGPDFDPDHPDAYDPSKLRHENGPYGVYEYYNGHPVSHTTCKRHAGRLTVASGRYAARKYRRNVPGAGGEPS